LKRDLQGQFELGRTPTRRFKDHVTLDFVSLIISLSFIYSKIEINRIPKESSTQQN
jgi:hypothetical protein